MRVEIKDVFVGPGGQLIIRDTRDRLWRLDDVDPAAATHAQIAQPWRMLPPLPEDPEPVKAAPAGPDDPVTKEDTDV